MIRSSIRSLHSGLAYKIAICALLILAVASSRDKAFALKDVEYQPSTQEWREDLRFLNAQMRLKHKSLFHTISEAEFSQAVEKLDSDIPKLNQDQIFVRFLQLMVMVQDGHSGFDLRPIPPPDLKDHIPARFVQYRDGIYIRGAAPEYADLVGGKVITVGGHDSKEAMSRVYSIESHDPGNDGEQLAWGAKTTLDCPRLLHGLNLTDSRDSVDFLVEKNGVRRNIRMKASVSIGEWYLNSLPVDWIDARPKSAPIPLSRQHEDQFYWFTYVPKHRAIYFQFNLVLNAQKETLADFSDRLRAELARSDVERVVIDIRNNTGGDNTLLRPLLLALVRSKLNVRGGIFAIIGPTTFSAAQNFTNRLENFSEVIYVGEPTGENVNFYGDPAGITLPRSHLEAAVSQLWWQDEDPRDKRVATFPEIALESSFQEYVSGVDSALEYALSAPRPETLEEKLLAAVPQGKEEVLAQYTAFVADPRHKYLPDAEAKVNSLGYKLMAAKHLPEAITVLEANVNTHPNSWNAYDSLGEAYLVAGDQQKALAAYRKSVNLNPKNLGAIRAIERIQNPH